MHQLTISLLSSTVIIAEKFYGRQTKITVIIADKMLV